MVLPLVYASQYTYFHLLDAERKGSRSIHGWQAVFGKAPKGAGADVQATLDQEFGKINQDDWK